MKGQATGTEHTVVESHGRTLESMSIDPRFVKAMAVSLHPQANSSAGAKNQTCLAR